MEGIAKKNNGDIEILYVDIDKFPEIGEQLDVQSIPTVFVAKDGELNKLFMGQKDEKTIDKMIGDLLGKK